MAGELHQLPKDARPMAVFSQRLAYVLDLALELRRQGRIEFFASNHDFTVIGFRDEAHVLISYAICGECGWCSPECPSLTAPTTCPACEERRLAKRHLTRLSAALSGLHDAHTTARAGLLSCGNRREGAA